MTQISDITEDFCSVAFKANGRDYIYRSIEGYLHKEPDGSFTHRGFSGCVRIANGVPLDELTAEAAKNFGRVDPA